MRTWYLTAKLGTLLLIPDDRTQQEIKTFTTASKSCPSYKSGPPKATLNGLHTLEPAPE